MEEKEAIKDREREFKRVKLKRASVCERER